MNLPVFNTFFSFPSSFLSLILFHLVKHSHQLVSSWQRELFSALFNQRYRSLNLARDPFSPVLFCTHISLALNHSTWVCNGLDLITENRANLFILTSDRVYTGRLSLATMVVQSGKKPVSNLSSALASIHLSKASTSGYPPSSQPPYPNTTHNNYHPNANDLTRYHDSSAFSHYSNDPYGQAQNYHATSNIDIPMRPQVQPHPHLPLDRIGEYRKNPPTEGISLFSHRVCADNLFLFLCAIR